MSSPLNRFKRNLKADFLACSGETNIFGLSFLFHAGFQTLFFYRCARLLYEWRLPIVSKAITAVARIITSCDVHYKAELDGGVMFPHGRGVVIGEGVKIAKKSSIFQHATIGGMAGEGGFPILEEGVNVYPGSVIAGGIRIGEYSRVGPNVYLTVSVPTHTRVAPAKPNLHRKHYES